MLKSWTMQRAAGVGMACGIAAVLIAAAIGAWPEALLYPYAVLLGMTALCGASILWITATDVRNRGRGGRMRPIRAFDIAIGLVLLVPALYALRLIWPELDL